MIEFQPPVISRGLLGLGNVNNTSDASKPVSVAQAAAVGNLQTQIANLAAGDIRIVGPGFDASSGAFPTSAQYAGATRAVQAGDTFRVTVAGTINGVSFVATDTITAIKNAPSASTYANNWQIGKQSAAINAADIRPFLTEATMLAATDVVANQRAQVAGREWIYKPLGTYTASPTVNNGTAFQLVSTSLTQDCTFAEETRTIAFLRSVHGPSGIKQIKYAGFNYLIDMAQVGSGVGYVTTGGGFFIYVNELLPRDWKAYGAKADGTTLDTAAIKKAIAHGPSFVSGGRYRFDEKLTFTHSVCGSGVSYDSPYITSALGGAILQPEGLADSSAVEILSNSIGYNKASYGGFGIDMTNMSAGSNADDFAIAAMTKGIYAENRHSLKMFDIEVFAVPANAAAFAFKSVQPGGGMYWGDYNRLCARTKKATGNDPTAKGFVLVGSVDEITAQEFTSCTSYRGWYLRRVNQSNFRSCHSEGAPKNSWLVDDCRNLLWEGGFHEGQGQEVADPENYHQFKGSTAPKRMTWINLSLSGNGITGFDKKDGHVKINTGGRIVGDQGLQEIGTLKVDEAGLVNMPSNSAFCGFLTSFNSTVPTATLQSIFFSSTTAGFDQAAEYNSGNGQYLFKNAGAIFGGITATYRVSVHLKITKAGGGAITAGTEVYFDIGGSGYAGPSKIKAISSGQATMYLVGSLLVRLSAASASFLQPKIYHNNGSDLAVNHASGAASDSWVAITKET